MKGVRIWRFSGPYSVQMQENTDQKNSKNRHFSCTGSYREKIST